MQVKVIPHENPVESHEDGTSVEPVHPVLPGSNPSEQDHEEALMLYNFMFPTI